MIKITAPWESKNKDEIQWLYKYLLLQTIPLPPKYYFPLDKNGKYSYFEYDTEGNRSNEIKTIEDINKPLVRWRIKKETTELLKKLGIDKSKFVSAEALVKYFIPGLLEDRVIERILCFLPNEANISMKNPYSDIPLQNSGDIPRKEVDQIICHEIFNYKAFSNKKLFGKLIQLMGIESCPYCNRSFTTTVRRSQGRYYRANEIDHYAPKGKYPWLALSIKNFIPCCSNCNLHKGDDADFVLYPYEEGFDKYYRFKTIPDKSIDYLTGMVSDNSDFHVEVEKSEQEGKNDQKYYRRAENSIECFGLKELYKNSHNGQLCEVFKQRYVFGEEYINSLMNSFPGLFRTTDEVFQMLYQRSIRSDDYSRAPLSKLIHDIDEEISKLHKSY